MTGSFHKIVLTGGPCAGKSTAQTLLSDVLENLGFKVFKISEVATYVFNGGIEFSILNTEEAELFQENLLLAILAVERVYFDLALSLSRRGEKVVVICDRGALDTSAFLERDQWQKILEKLGKHEIQLRDQSYDLVIHMASAALGAEQFYSSETNSVRSEGIDLARILDKRLADAWMGHPYFHLIDNSTGFQEKLDRVVSSVLSHLGLEDKRRGKGILKIKFKLDNVPEEFPISYRDFDVTHNYLVTSDDSKSRIRCRGSDGHMVYTLTIQRAKVAGQSIEVRRLLTNREYEALYHQKDQSRHPIIKKRRCFIWNQRYYQLDRYQFPCNGLVILEAYVDEKQVGSSSLDSIIPPFLKACNNNSILNVTDKKEFSMYELARINK